MTGNLGNGGNSKNRENGENGSADGVRGLPVDSETTLIPTRPPRLVRLRGWVDAGSRLGSALT